MDASWSLTEALEYYRSQGAPGAQTALVELLREVQAENGGVIPDAALAEIAAAYGLRESFLTAVLRRYPSLRTQQAPHRLEICGGPNCARQSSARLMAHIERTYGVRSGGISQSGGFSYRVIGCMKHCGKGPNVKWDGQIYNGVTPERVDRLIRGDG